jgi:hypothetical protein
MDVWDKGGSSAYQHRVFQIRKSHARKACTDPGTATAQPIDHLLMFLQVRLPPNLLVNESSSH